MERVTQLLAILVLAAVLCGEARAEAVPIPLERRPLTASGIELDFHAGRVEISVDRLEEPYLEIGAMGEVDDVAVVLVNEENGALKVVQPHGAERRTPSLRVRLVLDPSQRLVVNGRGLDVSVIDRREELGEGVWSQLDEEIVMDRAKAMRPGGTASRYRFEVEDASLTLDGLTGAQVSGQGNRVLLTRCRGPFVFDVEETETEIEDHWGSLYLRGRDSGFTLDVVDGNADLSLEASDLIVMEGRGRISGTLNGGGVNLTRWRGPVSLDGEEMRVTASQLLSEEHFLTVSGTASQLFVEELAGALRASLDGGRLEARDIKGRALLSGRAAADLQLSQAGDTVDVSLSDGSFARVERLEGRLEADVSGSELTAENVSDVELRGRDAVVSLSDLSGSLDAEMTATLFDAWTASRSSPRLSFAGESEVRLGVPTPCRVKLEGGAGRGGPPPWLSAGPCELFDSRSRRRYGGRVRPVTIVLSISGEAQVELWGR
jgi:hypothetical protein